eukprot:3091867-Alexandrium_andersonii.AAC.1
MGPCKCAALAALHACEFEGAAFRRAVQAWVLAAAGSDEFHAVCAWRVRGHFARCVRAVGLPS